MRGLTNSILIAGALISVTLLHSASAQVDREIPNYHLVGWANTFVPGSGQTILGDPATGLYQAGLEVGAFTWGWSLSKLSPLTLDGVPADLPGYRRRTKFNQQDISRPLYASILQEFGIKYHFVNTFTAYREAALLSHPSSRPDIDQTSAWDMFVEPFRSENLTDPWVYVPLSVITTGILTDYFFFSTNERRGARLTPYSNGLFAFNSGVWQPLGSGAPEEMFYRGFLQNEFHSMVPSPYFSILMSSMAFGFSHAASGRLSATLSGGYLGYLAYKYHGRLGPGITLHYWSVLMLGLEEILLNHRAQRTSPPASLYIQINY